MRVRFQLLYGFICIPLLLTKTFSQQNIDSEIIRLRKELSRQQVESQRLLADIEKEKKDFQNYKNNNNQRVKNLLLEMDSLKSDISKFRNKNDSLQFTLATIRTNTQQLIKVDDVNRKNLIMACNLIDSFINSLPPFLHQSLSASTSLLKSDLESKSVENIEGANRLFTLLSHIDEAAGNVQVSQEASPSPDLRGSVYRIRIGTFFEAAVDEKGEQAIVFLGYTNDGAPQWSKVNRETAAAIHTIVFIREGKTLPAFVRLPLSSIESKGISK